MLLKPGDKVSFLNEKRDGIVKKILNNKMVLIEIEDGFEIPVPEHDLIKVQPFEDRISNNRNSSDTNTLQPREIGAEPEQEERFPDRISLMTATEIKTRQGIYLAFIPEDPEKVLHGSIGIYLANHTSQDILFFYSTKEEGKFICKDFDRIDEQSALLLDIIDITNIEKWKDLQFQFLFFKQGSAVNKPPLVREIQLKPVRFYKEDNYSHYSFLDEKCFLISLTEEEQMKPEYWPEEKWKNEKIEKSSGLKIIGHIKNLNKIEPFPEKHILEKGMAEIDLHIEELTENYSGKENYELLNIQLDYFIKMLENAMANKFRKVIFIHGVGNGKLKQEIINKLSSNYPDLQYHDASYTKYGKGATEVLLTI